MRFRGPRGTRFFQLASPFALPLLVAGLLSCAHEPTPAAEAPAAVAEPLSPLPRACQDLLPLGDRGGALGRSVGELVRLLRRMTPAFQLEQRDCRAGDSWPIAYATGEADDSGRPPIGFEVLRMTGDALLTFDEHNRDSATVNLCKVLDFTLGPAHRVRAVALWDSADERTFDPAHPETSMATIAWLELFTRRPTDCALASLEEPGVSADAAMQQRMECARRELVWAEVPACPPFDGVTAADVADLPDATAIRKAVATTHRLVGEGRRQASTTPPPPGLELRLVTPELCLHEPAPAARDVCLAVYQDAGGDRWYGRGDVTRTGTGGVKNYVDSYLTFVLLKRIEAERKARSPAAPADAGPPAR